MFGLWGQAHCTDDQLAIYNVDDFFLYPLNNLFDHHLTKKENNFERVCLNTPIVSLLLGILVILTYWKTTVCIYLLSCLSAPTYIWYGGETTGKQGQKICASVNNEKGTCGDPFTISFLFCIFIWAIFHIIQTCKRAIKSDVEPT